MSPVRPNRHNTARTDSSPYPLVPPPPPPPPFLRSYNRTMPPPPPPPPVLSSSRLDAPSVHRRESILNRPNENVPLGSTDVPSPQAHPSTSSGQAENRPRSQHIERGLPPAQVLLELLHKARTELEEVKRTLAQDREQHTEFRKSMPRRKPAVACVVAK
ncbi:hypothetical protein LXA43DRAFT_1096265 [Ganoderma leucocontextum]|nr:hypothetical protein LXA43DRAFT_1096265 [Ganoderma leucocontextum]